MHIRNSFAGLQLVPPALVPLVRPLLASQGITDPGAIDNNGNVDPMALLALGFSTIEIRSALTPPVTIDLRMPADQQTDALLNVVQPVITFAGRAGRVQIAPYGVPEGITPLIKKYAVTIGVGLGAALVGVLLFGAVLGRR